MIAISRSERWQGLRAELWLCSPVWCALRMGHGRWSALRRGRMLGQDDPRFGRGLCRGHQGHQFENFAPWRAVVNAVLLFGIRCDRRNGRERERKT